MLAVLSGGGTAGHINPALALAEVLQERGWDVNYVGTPHGVEARLVPNEDIAFRGLEASGFDRAKPLTMLTGIASIARSTRTARAWFAAERPDVVVGFGGYVSLPVARAAEKLGIPVVVHEQNSVMGMANKYLARRAAQVCVTYGVSAEWMGAAANVTVTGNPVRGKVMQATRAEGRALLGIPDDALMLLVFGGSLGARHINTALCAMKPQLLGYPNLHVVHITGPKEFETVCEQLALSPSERQRWHVMGYQDRMGETLAAADCIVSRAGATSLAEISARAIPAVLVPFPYATDDHQTTNAREYVEAGCASMIADADLDTPRFVELVRQLVEDEQLRASMTNAARGLKTADAARMLADVVVSAAQAAAPAVK